MTGIAAHTIKPSEQERNPTATTRPRETSLEDFSERHRLVDVTTTDGKLLTDFASTIGNKLLTAGGVTLTHQVSYHISDDSQPNAFVAIEANTARVVLSKGIFSMVSSEDELAAVIGHELKHVHFREQLGHTDIQVTKVEEYIADVASVSEWMIKAGYAPKEAVKLFDDLKKYQGGQDQGLGKLLKPWVAFSDVHGLSENRSAAINGVIAKTIKETGAVPTTVTPVDARAVEALARCTHETYVERLLAHGAYRSASPNERGERILSELGALTTGQGHRLPELAIEFSQVLKEIPITQQVVERVYSLMTANKALSLPTQRSATSKLTHSLLDRVMAAAAERKIAITPPARNEAIAASIERFVKAKDDATIISLGREIAAFAREWHQANPGLHHSIAGSFSGRNGPESLTRSWGAHVQVAVRLARQGKPEIIEALWALSAYDDRLISCAPTQLLASLSQTPPLVPLAATDNVQLSDDGTWSHAASRTSNETNHRTYVELAERAAHERGIKQRIDERREVETARITYNSLEKVPVEAMHTSYESILATFADNLVYPSRYGGPESQGMFTDPVLRASRDLMISSDEEPPHEILEGHYRSAAVLTKLFTAMLETTDPFRAHRATDRVRAFFLNTSGPCYASFIGTHPVDKISRNTECRHPLVNFAASCPVLTSDERVTFLKGLEDRLPLKTWEKAYFTGESVSTRESKLEHLQRVAPYHEPARKIAAKLLTEEFERAEVGSLDVVSYIARFSRLMPAVRLAADDARNTIMDHILAQSTWNAPLQTRIDLFWGLEQGRLFPPVETGLRDSLRAGIIADLSAITDVNERRMLAERLLLAPDSATQRISQLFTDGDTAGNDGLRREFVNRTVGLNSLKDPVLRDAATTVWASAIRERLASEHPGFARGVDDGSANYISAVQPVLSHIVTLLRARLPIQERREMLNALAVELELQETLSFHLRDGISGRSKLDVADAHEYFRSAEAGFEFLNQDPQRREAALRFLAQPLTLDSIGQFASQADLYRTREVQAIDDALTRLLEEGKREEKRIQERIAFIESVDATQFIDTLIYDAYASLLYDEEAFALGFDSGELQESVAAALPDLLSDEERSVAAPEVPSTTLSMEESLQYIVDVRERALPLISKALEGEKERFQKVFTTGEAILKQGRHPVPSIKKALLVELSNLPEYDFVGKLEAEVEKATTPEALGRVFSKALKNLDKEFTAINEGQQRALTASLKKLSKSTEQKDTDNRKRLLAVAKDGAVYQRKLKAMATLLPELTSDPKFSFVARILDTPPEQLCAESFAITDQETRLLQDLDYALSHKESDLREQRTIVDAHNQRIEEIRVRFEEQRERLKKLPAPITSVLGLSEEALEMLEMEEIVPEATGDDHALARFPHIYADVRRNTPPSATPMEEQQARQLYELFWSQSAEVRAIALKLLLLPPQSEYEDRNEGADSHYAKAFDFVADQIFPEGMRYGSEARDILRIFLEETDPSLRGFMLGALMSASEKIAGAPEEYTAGKRLAMILSMLGPAEKKLGQAINSHPLTPEDLRSDTKSIKSHSDPLSRWDLIERISEALPPEYKDTFPRFGRAFGAASYYLAVECDDTVLSILRPHARTLADTGLARMERVATRLEQIDSLKNVAGPFVESIRQAREMIEVETDHETGVQQQRNAWRRYDGVSVTVEGERFDIHTAAWKACGPEFRHQEKIAGEHFLDLLQSNDPKDPFTRKAAIAYLSVEFLNLLSGDTFDHDSHGANVKIQRGSGIHRIGRFDHGCMAVRPPSEAERRECAEIMCDLVQGYLSGSGGILERAHSIIREKREREGVSPSYLISFERALLALNDFMRFDSSGTSTLLQPTDLGAVLAATFQTGKVDPIFAQTIAGRFGGPAAQAFLSMLPHTNVCKLIAQKIEERIGAQNQISMEFAPQSSMPEPIVFDSPKMSDRAT